MLVNGQKLAAIALAMAKNNNSVYQLDNLYIQENGMVNASNGHSLYWTTSEPAEKLQDFPQMNETDYKADLPVLIPAAGIKKAIGNLPKKLSLQILENIAIDSREETRKTTLTTTDLDTTDNVIVKRSDCCFPDVDAIRNTERKETIFHISIDEMETLVKVSKKLGLKGCDCIKIGVHDENSPVSAEIKKGEHIIKGLIMPCHDNSDN